MHCWRHKTPIILRATTQWFAGMDEVPGYNGVKPRKRCAPPRCAASRQHSSIPDWGKARLHGMIANRPDWTLSRARQWGVPMPFFVHKETGALHPRTLELLEQVAQRVEKGGIEAWQTVNAEELLGADAAHYEKVKDTLDVWFDSGSTHYTVLRGSHAAESAFPADLYLEGSDQHRGWFHSSLLVVVHDGRRAAVQGAADARLRRRRRPQDDQVQGQRHRAAEGDGRARRRHPAAVGGEHDYSGELSISNEILKRVVESYRRIRNTLRFLLANTADFDPAKHAVPVADMARSTATPSTLAPQLQARRSADYERYQFHLVAQKLQTFCSEDLGGFYLDILKDRLYTSGADSRARRSAQNALWHIAHSLVRLMAPILSFTAEEAWPASPRARARQRVRGDLARAPAHRVWSRIARCLGRVRECAPWQRRKSRKSARRRKWARRSQAATRHPRRTVR